MAVSLPRPMGLPAGLSAYLNLLVERIETELERMQATQATPYQVTNSTPTRVFDADGATIATTDDVLGTLIQDLQKKGVLR